MKADNCCYLFASATLLTILVSAENNLYHDNKEQESSKNRHKIKKLCQNGYFISYGDNKIQCKLCSVCPQDQIIRKLCSSFNDTICGPFYEFQSFYQEKEIEISHSFSDISHNEEQNNKLEIDNVNEQMNINITHNYTKEDLDHEDNTIIASPVTETSYEDESSIWKKLSFGLVGVLILMTFIGLSYEIFTVIKNKKKKVPDDSFYTESNSHHPYRQVTSAASTSNNCQFISNCCGLFENSWLFHMLRGTKIQNSSTDSSEAPPLLPLFLLSNNIKRAVDNNYVPEPCKTSNIATQQDEEFSNNLMVPS